MKLRQNWPLFAAILWALGLVGIAVQGYLSPLTHSVFEIYAIGSRDWWDGAENIYAKQSATHEIFRYSPAFAVLFSPLAYLPPGVGNALWKLFNGGVFLGGFWYWLSRGSPESLSPNARAAIFLVALPIAMLSLHVGQANLLMTGFLFIGIAAAADERWWLAAGAIAAATLVKAYPIAFAAVLSVVYWRHFCWRFAVSLAVGLVFPFAVKYPNYALEQTRNWMGALREGTEINRDRLKSLDRLFEILGVSIPTNLFLILGALAGLGVLAISVVYVWRGADRRRLLTFSLSWTLTWFLLFSPATEAVTFSILAPPLAWALVVAFRRPRAWFDRVLLLVAVFLVGPIQSDLVGKSFREFGGSFAAPTWGTVLFAVWLALEFARFISPGRFAKR